MMDFKQKLTQRAEENKLIQEMLASIPREVLLKQAQEHERLREQLRYLVKKSKENNNG